MKRSGPRKGNRASYILERDFWGTTKHRHSSLSSTQKHQKMLKRQFEYAVKKSQLEGVIFHTLRHTAASHMVMSGVPLATVKESLRHKDYAMTLRYAQLSSEHTKAAIDALGDSLTVKSKEETKTA